MNFYELNKIPKSNDGTAEWPWLDFFKNYRNVDFKMCEAANEYLKNARIRLKELSKNDEERNKTLDEEFALMDMITFIEDAKEDGIEQE